MTGPTPRRERPAPTHGHTEEVHLRHVPRLDPVGVPALVAVTVLCLGLLVLRAALSGEVRHGFLVWNVFLAWLPVPLAWAALRAHAHGARVGAVVLGGAWLAFLPNAPYLVTDLIHVRRWPSTVLLYDTVMFGAFAVLGLLLGAAALRPMHRRIDERFGLRGSVPLLGAIGLLTGFGIYLGRVQRWNSWAVLESPLPLAREVWSYVADPLAHPQTVATTVGFGTLFVVSYLLVAGLRPAPDEARRPRRR